MIIYSATNNYIEKRVLENLQMCHYPKQRKNKKKATTTKKNIIKISMYIHRYIKQTHHISLVQVIFFFSQVFVHPPPKKKK